MLEAHPDNSAVYWAYDQLGRRSMLSTTDGPTYLVYDYDKAGRLTSVDGWGEQLWGDAPWGGAGQYDYDENGNITKKVLANGVFTYFAYDNANRLISLHNCKADGTPLTYFDYTYDQVKPAPCNGPVVGRS